MGGGCNHPVRMRGLVRTMNQVRAQLAAGIPAEQAEAFRRQVRQARADVERICRAHGQRPEDLPAPSRRAYRFLADLDLRRLPIRPAGEAAPPAPRELRIKNLVGIADWVQAELEAIALQIPPPAGPIGPRSLALDTLPAAARPRLAALRARIAEDLAKVERICRERGGTPGMLPIRSRRAFLSLRTLAEADALERQIRCLALAQHLGRPLLEARQDLGSSGVRTLRVQMLSTGSVVRGQAQGSSYLVRLHPALLGAPDEVIALALRTAFGDRAALAELRGFTRSEAFLAALGRLEGDAPPGAGEDEGHAAGAADDLARASGAAAASRSAGAPDAGPAAPPAGRHHDLGASFDRVNRGYFGGAMPRPRLAWNATITHRKLGHYAFASDSVMISITLDDRRVPDYVLDFVMYHELLHKHFGRVTKGGRVRSHTPAFRKAERQFRDYRRAEAFLSKLHRRLGL